MKLNPDCIRDLLICLETHLEMSNNCHLGSVSLNQIQESEEMRLYDQKEIVYTMLKLIEARFVIGKVSYGGKDSKITMAYIDDITWDGHQFLNTVRPDTVWQATKKGASKLGLMSVHALSGIAMKLAETIISDPSVIAKIVLML